jgi:predicted alpha/beta-hydrolase family hydrolase
MLIERATPRSTPRLRPVVTGRFAIGSLYPERMPSESMIDTAHGSARVIRHPVRSPRGLLVLGHGAGGGVGAPDLLAATAAAREIGVEVALVEQPYRVAGRKVPSPAPQLDAAWSTVLATLRAAADGLPVVTGGRSSGARVACRTALAVGASGVLCLAFPLFAPARKSGERPSRQAELDGAGVPVLVIQGLTDPFGMPQPAPDREVVEVVGDHGLKKDLPTLRAAVARWLDGLLPA